MPRYMVAVGMGDKSTLYAEVRVQPQIRLWQVNASAVGDSDQRWHEKTDTCHHGITEESKTETKIMVASSSFCSNLSAMPEIIFATSNAHKTQEVAAMLGDVWNVQSLCAYPGITLPEETGTTFEANAVIKAVGASVALPGLLILADDSGLEVDALNGEPGVYSARYAGVDATDADNRRKLKDELRKQASNSGRPFLGRFRCCLALVRDGQVLKATHGAVEGSLRLQEQGSGGFGYDALFQPVGYEDTFGVLSAEVKNSLSHRACAMAEMKAWLAGNLMP